MILIKNSGSECKPNKVYFAIHDDIGTGNIQTKLKLVLGAAGMNRVDAESPSTTPEKILGEKLLQPNEMATEKKITWYPLAKKEASGDVREDMLISMRCKLLNDVIQSNYALDTRRCP